MVLICNQPYPINSKYEEYFELYPYILSDFQKYAIEAIVEGHHVLVTAHTGSGKTLPAEFSIEHFVKLGKKVVYTSPIKALSNQKYSEFSKKYPHISFGLMTGDIKTNPDADVLIMTTEILMNALFQNIDNTSKPLSNLQFNIDIMNDLGCVVFDEVHYINDIDRGQTWEKTILMLPKHIQMVMLSATIDNPERFAKWAERGDTSKQVYLASTNKRVVPLSHYGYLAVPEGTLKIIKDKELVKEIRDATQTLIPLQSADGVFSDSGYKTLSKMTKLFETKQFRINRKFLLNNLALFLRDREMLPAIVFVFSRKLVEAFAQEITVPLLEDDSKIPYTVRRECEQIVRKFSNFQEYLELPEYNKLVSLLEKGIGIHHSGMIPVLREIVEIMISKRYIKILFATESFAIGLDCPIKTAVFSALEKFDGSNERLLMGHEYTQMAGRAGRRGIDTVGYVVHCNNIFQLPSSTQYQCMLKGKAQELSSKFRISYSLILNLIKKNNSKRSDFIDFISKSMIQNELTSDIQSNVKIIADKKVEYEQSLAKLEYLRTPVEVCKRFIEIEETIKTTVNKKRKELEREIREIKENYKYLAQDTVTVIGTIQKEKSIYSDQKYLDYLKNYISEQVHGITNILLNKGFIEPNEDVNVTTCDTTNILYNLTELGKVGSGIGEIHPLVLSEYCIKSNWFDNFDPVLLVGLLATFVDVKVSDDSRLSFPHSSNSWLKEQIIELQTRFNYYSDVEAELELKTGIDYTNALNYDMNDFAMHWCKLDSENDCKYFIQNNLAEKGISVGDFCKAILKISTISKELGVIAETMGKIDLLYKLTCIDKLILKYITTSQSLYV